MCLEKPASGKIVIKALESQRYSILESKNNKTTKNCSDELIMIDSTIFCHHLMVKIVLFSGHTNT